MDKVLKVAVPILLLFLLLVWQRIHLVKLNLRLEELRTKRNHLLTQVHSLEVSAESLESYARIERFAMSKLDMFYPDSKDIVYIKKDNGR